MIDLTDNKGNRIISKHKKGLYYLYLFLRGKKFPRAIGILNPEKKQWIVKRDPNKHTFLKNDCYWFNREVVDFLDNDWKVIIKQPKTKLTKTCMIWDIKKNNSHLYFMTQWFELQVFFPKGRMDIEFF